MTEDARKPEVISIPVARVKVPRDRQRSDMGDMESLSMSIERRGGLICPIVVNAVGEEYILVAGGRRLAAYKALDRFEIPAILRENLDDLEKFEIEYEENVQRKSLSWLEEAKAITRLHTIKNEKNANVLGMHFGRKWTQKDTAKELKISEAKVSQDMQLAELAEYSQDVVSAPTRKDALKIARRIKSGLLKPDIQEQVIKESFCNKDAMSALEDTEISSVDLIITDVLDILSLDLMREMAKRLTPGGNAFLFLTLGQVEEFKAYCTELRLIHASKPYIWNVPVIDDYHPFIWFSNLMSEPPKYVKTMISHRADGDALHTRAKSKRVLSDLVLNSTQKGGFVLDINAFSMNLADVCTDNKRNCRVYCANTSLYEALLLRRVK